MGYEARSSAAQAGLACVHYLFPCAAADEAELEPYVFGDFKRH